MIALPVEHAHPVLHRHAFDNGEKLATQLAQDVGKELRAAIERRGKASLIVSGGKSPVAFFEALSRFQLPWDRVFASLADERWAGEADRNETLVRKHLLANLAATARFIPLKTPALEPELVISERMRLLRLMPLPFDVVVLGMGEDGHTASLFPGAEGIESALDSNAEPGLVVVTPPSFPNPAPYRRLSLNLAACLDARRIMIQIQGAAKRAVLEQAREHVSPVEMPIAAVLQQARVPVDVYWAP
jgi:6-phosphogluconolactonase